jgi:signal transduction histidine kinase
MLRRKSGKRFFAFLVLRTTADGSAHGRVVVLSVQDIDREKKVETAIRGTHYEDLVKMADGIAHELRNPLVGIGGFVRRLYQSCPHQDEHDTYYHFILNNLKRIESLVRKTEYFARLPKPRFSGEPLRDLIEKAIEPFRPELAKRAIELHTDIQDVTLFVDPELFARVISILVGNALDALSAGQTLTLSSRPSGEGCLVLVHDTGSGISEQDLPYLFNPFFSTKPDGAGIDLAIAKRIMESHSGQIEAHSEPGAGTTFSLWFPFERRRPIRLSKLEDA